MERSQYTEANRLAWNEAEPVHRAQTFDELRQKFSDQNYNDLDSTATEILQSLSLSEKSVAHLCCNNGRELISIKNLGAGRCIGFDISEGFLNQAKELNQIAKRDCEFIQSDLYEIPDQFNESFDLVIFTIGAFCWLPTINQCFEKVASLLRPQGHLFIYEMHPALDMFEQIDGEDPRKMQHSYFKDDPFIESDGLDYFSGKTYESALQYCFHHKLSDIFSAILDQGLQIQSFKEYDYDISNTYEYFDELDIKPPMCYSLVAELCR